MFRLSFSRGPAPRGICWSWRQGFCARGRDCIYQHEETPQTRSDNRMCRWEYATKCHSRGGCGQQHLQRSISGAGDLLRFFESFGHKKKDLTQRDLGQFLRVALDLFVDGDQELRFHILSTLSSQWHLQQLKLCLHPNFFFQPYPPQISWQEHVVPLLRIMSDPVNTVHEPSMQCLRKIYELVLDPKYREFWRRVLKFVGGSLKLFPLRVAAQITGVITIFLLAIGFDKGNLQNVIVKDSVPSVVQHLATLQNIYEHGYLSPALAEAVEALKLTVSGELNITEALTTITGRFANAQISGSRALGPNDAQAADRAKTIVREREEETETPKEPLEVRLLALKANKLMERYLEGLSGRTVNGELMAGMGFVDCDVGDEPRTEAEVLEDELEKIAYAPASRGDTEVFPASFGLFSIEPRKQVVSPMVFTNDAGDALFHLWKKRAADPTKLNLDWGKDANSTSMKDFLQLTLTLFVAASTETRLRFISEYLLKAEYIGKMRECLGVKLPTDSINHPSPKYSDHVATIIHIMSHPDVAYRREFQTVRKEFSEMFASVPNYLYGILGYMKLRSRSKAKNTEMIEACAKSIIIILEGVFKLVDPRNIPMEFRHEAKEFLQFALYVENTATRTARTDSLMTETVQSFMRADRKLFPESNPPQICSSRQEDKAREENEIKSGIKLARPTTEEIKKDVSGRIEAGTFVRRVNSYLGIKSEDAKKLARRRELERRRTRKENEEGWDDGKPIIHEAEWIPQDALKPVEETKPEVEEEARPMNDEEALRYLAETRTNAEVSTYASLSQKIPIVNGNVPSYDAGLKSEKATHSEVANPVKDRGCSSGTPPGEGSVLSYLSEMGPSPSDGEAALEKLWQLTSGSGLGALRAKEFSLEGSSVDKGDTKTSAAPTVAHYGPSPSPPLPAMGSKDSAPCPNAHILAAELKRGRYVGRLKNRHDQSIIPRRVSDIRNPDAVKEYLPCGHTRGMGRDENFCNERVIKKTPYCGHEANVECSNQMKRWKCKTLCEQLLSCGHLCQRICYQCLDEIKLDGTVAWDHQPCYTCQEIRVTLEKKQERERREQQEKEAKGANNA
ncbi:hypothetical protein TWF730_003710 [Orbilia blumenaviensis]|uniref:C3H1-type domain-containing protein n=1 Tax=Orbilia blumenaviensis TaxID=1796055 RepID=A0AAV9U7D6_9PEZI